jgi:hypothetical protein
MSIAVIDPEVAQALGFLLHIVPTFSASHTHAKVRLRCPLLNPLSRGEPESERVEQDEHPRREASGTGVGLFGESLI